MSRWTNLPLAVRVATVAWPLQVGVSVAAVEAGVPGVLGIAGGTALAALAGRTQLTPADREGEQ